MGKIQVIKIGSTVLLTGRGAIDEFRIHHLCSQICTLHQQGTQVVLVISGAVGCGLHAVTLPLANAMSRQAAAGVGQVRMMTLFQTMFGREKKTIAQILITKEQLTGEEKRAQVRKLILSYLRMHIIPILNENDVIALNDFGGNDFLACDIALLISADELLMLSSMKRSRYGVGGGETKKTVKKILTQNNIAMHIVDGKEKNILLQQTIGVCAKRVVQQKTFPRWGSI